LADTQVSLLLNNVNASLLSQATLASTVRSVLRSAARSLTVPAALQALQSSDSLIGTVRVLALRSAAGRRRSLDDLIADLAVQSYLPASSVSTVLDSTVQDGSMLQALKSSSEAFTSASVSLPSTGRPNGDGGSSGSSGMPTGAIVGIVIGACVLLGVVALLVYRKASGPRAVSTTPTSSSSSTKKPELLFDNPAYRERAYLDMDPNRTSMFDATES
jgi:hypothetical protein